jgi:hypothetical protein
LPAATPGDNFQVQLSGDGKMALTRLEPLASGPAEVRIEKRGKFSVGVLNRPINEAAPSEALADFP